MVCEVSDKVFCTGKLQGPACVVADMSFLTSPQHEIVPSTLVDTIARLKCVNMLQ